MYIFKNNSETTDKVATYCIYKYIEQKKQIECYINKNRNRQSITVIHTSQTQSS